MDAGGAFEKPGSLLAIPGTCEPIVAQSPANLNLVGHRGPLEIPCKYDYHTLMGIIRPRRVLPRLAAGALERLLEVMPVVVMIGARQTGKTTLVRSHPKLATRPYFTLDDIDVRMDAEADPESLVGRAPFLIIDEVQRASDVLIAVKRAVDLDVPRRPGRFVLTGSANLLMLARVSESLAGRAGYVTLWPLARRERLGLGRAGVWTELLAAPFRRWAGIIESLAGPQEDWKDAVRAGGFPVPAYELESADDRTAWFSAYVQTYLERDLQVLRAIENLADFRRLMKAACLRLGGLLNQTELGRDTGIVQPQVHRFLNLLETSYQVVRLSAYSVNRTRRLIKAPKLYWSDPALALHLSGETEPRGAHLENLVLMDLLAWRDAQPRSPEILYWRTASGTEVDFVIEAPKRLLPIEIKASRRVSTKDARGLETFLDEYADLADGGLLLHAGDKTLAISKRVLAVPWWAVC